MSRYGRHYDEDLSRRSPRDGDMVTIRGRGCYRVLTENQVNGDIKVRLPDGQSVWVDRVHVAVIEAES